MGRNEGYFSPLCVINKGCHQNSLARWLKDLIFAAYSFAKLPPPNSASKTHEVRRISTTIGFEKNVSLTAILKAAYWKREDTFIGHYLRDIRVRNQDDTFGVNAMVASGQALDLSH